jgi:predicted RNA binding protein YcfA (HicA-like mRNA interferase family)
MPTFGPISGRELIRYLKLLGFEGPFSGSKHALMMKGDLSIRIPNPHEGDIGRELLARILRQAGVSREEWENLK